MNVEPLLEVQRRSYAAATTGLRAAWPESAALDGRRMAALLERQRYCVLATGRADGRPHASPVAFVVGDGAFWIVTVEGLRLRNLRATPWASVVVMEGNADEGEKGDAHRAPDRGGAGDAARDRGSLCPARGRVAPQARACARLGDGVRRVAP